MSSNLPYPKYIFLDYPSVKHDLMMHGLTNRDLELGKPMSKSAVETLLEAPGNPVKLPCMVVER